jgi:crossover junction endodeoxyribonuclease RusA
MAKRMCECRMPSCLLCSQMPGSVFSTWDEDRIELVLPYPISSNRYWRPVRIGNHITIVPTSEAKAYRKEVSTLATRAGVTRLHGRLAMTLRLYPHRPQDWAKRARKDPDNWADTVMCIDLGNCEKVLSDALNGIAWEDDKQLLRIQLERAEPDQHGARVVVTITALRRELVAPGLFQGAA